MKDKRVLVVGLGVSGRSAAAFLKERGAYVWAVDDDPERMRGFDCTFPNAFDLVVVSPGIPKSHPYYLKDVEVIGEMELGCRYLHNPCVAITGTNGKTTVSELVAHVLRFAGFPVQLLGNGGIPLTSVQLKEEIVVLELSSFQLETLSTKVLDAAVILNISEDHLDRYPDFEAYVAAKLRIQNCIKPGGTLIAHPHVAPLLKSDYQTFQVASRHDEENANAAFALCQTFGITYEMFKQAHATFKKPSHRMEYVTDIHSVSYYNDSKGTNVDAVIRAVNTLEGRVLLIAGGVDKGATFTRWIPSFKNKVAHIFAIGEAAEKIKRQLEPDLPVKQCDSLKSAVMRAAEIAKPCDHVLLSPGCASFDLFRSYADRGDQFKKIVRMMEHEST